VVLGYHILSVSTRFAEVFQGFQLGRALIDIGKPAVGHCPLCPQKRTFVSALSMSTLCQ
jgi:hypothetical protein